MTRRRDESAWIRPERRRLFPAPDTAAGEALRRAGRIARAAMLLGMKVTRTALDEGIRLLEHPEPVEAEGPAERVQKIEIK
jgi:hypothetical protein